MTARLVAVGRKSEQHPTPRIRYAITDPLWSGRYTDAEVEADPDLYRKQEIEARLAWGDDL